MGRVAAEAEEGVVGEDVDVDIVLQMPLVGVAIVAGQGPEIVLAQGGAKKILWDGEIAEATGRTVAEDRGRVGQEGGRVAGT